MRKNLRHLRNLRDKKKRPKENLCKSVGQKTPMKKSVYICEICGTFSNLRGYLQRPDRSHLRNLREKNNRSTQMILPDFILFIWSFHYLIIPLQATLKWYTFKLEYKRKWSSKILSAS